MNHISLQIVIFYKYSGGKSLTAVTLISNIAGVICIILTSEGLQANPELKVFTFLIETLNIRSISHEVKLMSLMLRHLSVIVRLSIYLNKTAY